LLDKGADGGGFTGADFARNEGDAAAVQQLLELAEQLLDLAAIPGKSNLIRNLFYR